MTAAPTRKPRETAAQRAEREWAELRAVAEAAGYISPYPPAGEAPQVTLDDVCPGCGRVVFVTLRGEVKCAYEKCDTWIIESPEETP